MKKRKVAILACLSTLNPVYSIAGVVHDQLHLLSKHEDVVFITTDDFESQSEVPNGVEVRYYPRYQGSTDPDEIDFLKFEQYIFETSSILRNHLQDCSHVIQHDLLFITSFLPMNWAIRHCGKLLPKLKWLHWQHSSPSPKPTICEYPFTGCYMDMPNSKFIYLNRTDIPGVAERYSIPENKVFVVHNAIDFNRLFKLHPITQELVSSFDLLSTDYLCIYPSRLVDAKQPHKIIKLMEAIKSKKKKVKLVFCNSWSNGQREQEYMKKLIAESTLSDQELIFTSEFKSNWCKENKFNIQLGVPREVSLDLMKLSDLFILPSVAECCSMMMLEAAATKNLLILNDDLQSLHEFGGQKINGDLSERTLYMQFGSITRGLINYLPSEEAWLSARADQIIEVQKNNQAIGMFKFVRKRHNPEWIYTNEILPLLEL